VTHVGLVGVFFILAGNTHTQYNDFRCPNCTITKHLPNGHQGSIDSADCLAASATSHSVCCAAIFRCTTGTCFAVQTAANTQHIGDNVSPLAILHLVDFSHRLEYLVIFFPWQQCNVCLHLLQAFLDVAEVTDRILSVVKNFDQVDANKVTPETHFTKDLGLDSLDVVEVVMAIEDEFAIEIPDQEADKIATISDAVNYISSHPMAK
jgi:acyl carrier protein